MDQKPIILRLGNLKPCPFCGSAAELHIDPMWHGSHGYHDCYDFYVKCPQCGVTRQVYNTIYDNDENKATQKAIDSWNTRYQETDTIPFKEGYKYAPVDKEKKRKEYLDAWAEDSRYT